MEFTCSKNPPTNSELVFLKIHSSANAICIQPRILWIIEKVCADCESDAHLNLMDNELIFGLSHKSIFVKNFIQKSPRDIFK